VNRSAGVMKRVCLILVGIVFLSQAGSAASMGSVELAQQPVPTAPPQNGAIIQPNSPEGNQSFSEPLPVPTASEDPLQFTFPAPQAETISAWRPPLLPVPWAMTPYDHFYFARPIGVDNVNWASQDYRYGDFFPDSEIVHTGIDIGADRGTPVIAAAEGKVTWAGEGLFKGGATEGDPYGLAVAIRHNFSFNGKEIYTIYAHMDRVDVIVGQKVKTGDQLGIVGITGKTTGPHLHFEVRLFSNSFFDSRNPELWLAPPEGWGVLVGRMIDRYNQPLYKVNVKVISVTSNTTWTARTYGPTSVNGDDYYRENLVLSDLPAGEYWIMFRVRWRDYQYKISIRPGMVNYFTFWERPGTFSEDLPITGTESQFPPVDPEQFINP